MNFPQGYNPSSATFYLAQLPRVGGGALQSIQVARNVQSLGFPNSILPGYQPNVVFEVEQALPGDFVLWQPSFGVLLQGLSVTSATVPTPGLILLEFYNSTDAALPLDQPFSFILFRGS